MKTVARSTPTDRISRLAPLLAGALLIGCSGSIPAHAPGGDGTSVPGTGTGRDDGPGGGGTGMTGTTPGNPGNGSGAMTPTTGGLDPGSVPANDYMGPRPLRRLTRSQYNNTVRDLLGVTGDVAAGFGIDEEDGGFASNNRAPLEELQLENYQQAAEQLADKAVANLSTLVPCAPPAGVEADCVDQFVRGFGKRVYRRPLSDVEVTRYKTLFSTGRTSGTFSDGVSLVVTAMLQSPNFLYLVETGDPKTPAVGNRLPLSPYEIGTRLSYFLIDSTPDDLLMASADAGKLSDPTEIAGQARRLLTSDKARDTMVSFFEQWLQVDDLLTVEKDPKVYPLFTPEVRAAMRDEVLEFTDQVARLGDSRLATLLTATFSFWRGPIYPVYGQPAQSSAGGSILHKVTLPANQRAGVFTLAGVLADHGHADQSSPVGRGLLVSDRLLCVTPPPPPPGVDNNIPAIDPNVSTRVRFEMHRSKPECAACHQLMDPLGIPFEIYDGMGRYRTMDGNKAVDPASMLTGTKASDGPITNALDLMTKLSTAEETRTCMTKQMFRYAFGRQETGDDQAILTEAMTAFAKNDYKITDLMVALATSSAFRTRALPDLR